MTPTWSRLSRRALSPKYRRSSSSTIGSTLRLTETRGVCWWPASAQAVRNMLICSACSSSNGTPVSSVRRVELIRFIPCSAVHTAVAREPAPHQTRRARSGEFGWTGSLPVPPPKRGSPSATPAPVMACRNTAACRRAMSAAVSPSAGTWPNTAAPSRAGSGEPRLMPSCSLPPLIRSVADASSAMYRGFSYRMSITPVPISILLVRAAMAASNGNGEACCRAKWCTRKNAPSIPSSSAATASSMPCSRASRAVCVRDPSTLPQWPKERNPMRFMTAATRTRRSSFRPANFRAALRSGP